ncbi:MAG: Fic family protein [Gemmatimonadaceae bacterium]
MQRTPQGHYQTVTTGDENFKAFIPAPLPPKPAVEWSPLLRRRFDDALVALGRLDAITSLLPDASLLLYSFIRKEAVLSSQIEGTQSSLADLMLYEIEEQPGVPIDDAREVSRCVAALDHAVARMRSGFPLCVRLLREMHDVLMSHSRGEGKAPGQVRRSQVWVGGTRPGNAAFVPPPATALADCLKHFEKFLNDEPDVTSPLLKAALAHVQFETIHPFLDGNGRIGRLLIVLQLLGDGVMREPLLYPSLFFKQHRTRYYDLLNGVRLNGDWESWLDFFAEGVHVTANDAFTTANALLTLVNQDRTRIAALGRPAASTLIIHDGLQRHPLSSASSLVELTGLTPRTVNKSLMHLVELGIISELTGRQRGRVFSYDHYIARLNAVPF